ncbi:SDR family oxidoreductase [Fodinibius sp. Rm-B-1B1-1]|uniref:SDR family oxidoreductase n=1 Tax=Fodinibius alkaliphilus TaxID=3140241 RepID=UPI00315B31B4
MSDFNGKDVLITGGAGGIGLLMGKHALKAGANKLFIWDISSEAISNAHQTLSKYNNQVYSYEVDIAKPNQIYQTADRLLKAHGPVDILINNAGTVVGGPFKNYAPQQIEHLIRLNLLGAMHTTQAFLDNMITQKSGHIVNIASAAGRMANPNMSVYTSSKWGLIGWSDSLRLELKSYPHIHVSTIEPSYINTGLFEGVTPPALTPLLDAGEISEKIIKAIRKNKTHLREPFMVKILPFLKGILPTPVFDFVAGQLFQVYHSMDTFTGRT